MINVDEDFAIFYVIADRAQPLVARAVGGDDAVEFFTAFRFFNQVVADEKFIFQRNGILIPDRDAFTFVAQRERKAELRADAIAVRPHMADDAKSFIFADDLKNAINDFWITFHKGSSVGPLSTGEVFSSSSRICSTRLPRTMESSTMNFSVGVNFSTTDLATNP